MARILGGIALVVVVALALLGVYGVEQVRSLRAETLTPSVS